MQVLTPGTVDVPPPAELAGLFTTTDSTTPAGTVIKPKDRAGKALTARTRSSGRGTPTASRLAEFLHNMRLWTAENPQQAADYEQWWETTGKHDADRLIAWMEAQASRAARGLPLSVDWPGADAADPPPKKTPRPQPPQDITPAGRPGRPTPNAAHPGETSPHPSKTPPRTILESATQAAEWLAQRWPDAVKNIGYSTFIDARKRDVLEGIWTFEYWEPLARLDPAACVSPAFNTLDPDWDTPPFNDEEHKRGIATYAKPSAPYPLPAPYTTGAHPSPGYTSKNDEAFLADLYSACWIENYTLPERWNTDDMPPTFLDTHSNHYVTADAPPSRVQFSTYSLPHIYKQAAPGAPQSITLPLYGRRYNWTTKIPPGGAAPYVGHMRRHFIQDCRVMAMLAPDAQGACDRLSVQLAPGAAMARYFGKAANIATEFTLENPAAYVARDPSDGFTGADQYDLVFSTIEWYVTTVGAFIDCYQTINLQHGGWQSSIADYDDPFPYVTLPFRTRFTNFSFNADRYYGPSSPQVQLRKIGPEHHSILLGNLFDANIRNNQDFRNPGGDIGVCTIWHVPGRGWFVRAGMHLTTQQLSDAHIHIYPWS